MRVALLAPLRHPIREPYAGGLEWHTAELARGLAARGHDVTLIAHPDSRVEGNLLPVTTPENVSNWGYLPPIRRATKLLDPARFDVVINNSIHFLPDLLRPRNLPMLSVLHTPPYRLHRLLGRWAAKRSSLVAISKSLGETWRPRLGHTPAIIYNGVDTDKWTMAGAGEERTAIWYGRITPEKGPDIAIRVARAAGWKLRLAGPVYDQGFFRSRVKPLLGGPVEYLGHLPQNELIRVVQRCRVGLVTPRWEEPFGLVYAEMMACGLPVVGFRSGAAREVIPPQHDHLVPMGEEGAIPRVLSELNKGNGGEKRRILSAYVRENFSLGRMIDDYERTLRDLTQ